jgi:hypothetical protein
MKMMFEIQGKDYTYTGLSGFIVFLLLLALLYLLVKGITWTAGWLADKVMSLFFKH